MNDVNPKYVNYDDYNDYNDNNDINNSTNLSYSELSEYSLLFISCSFLCGFVYATIHPTIRKKFRKCINSCVKKQLKKTKFSSLSAEQLINECSICLEPYKQDDDIIILKCGHLFHESCIKTWITPERQNCPNCRSGII